MGPLVVAEAVHFALTPVPRYRGVRGVLLGLAGFRNPVQQRRFFSSCNFSNDFRFPQRSPAVLRLLLSPKIVGRVVVGNLSISRDVSIFLGRSSVRLGNSARAGVSNNGAGEATSWILSFLFLAGRLFPPLLTATGVGSTGLLARFSWLPKVREEDFR